MCKLTPTIRWNGLAAWVVGMLAMTVVMGQGTGSIVGRVFLPNGTLVVHSTVLIVDLGLEIETNDEGAFQFETVPAGTYDLVAHLNTLSSQSVLVSVAEGAEVSVDLILVLTPIRESITVTASGRHESTFEAVQSVTSLDTFDLAEKLGPSLGEVLDGEPGISKRSFGPGSARPVIRGFDGDRVLVMADGVRTASLGSQSSEHGDSIDPGNLERVEVVKGPATLLYGSSAIGGVVNAVSRHHEMHRHQHEGIRGQMTAGAGTNNGMFSTSANVEYGFNKWMVWAGGGGQRTSDYQTPLGDVENSETRLENASGGAGWFGERVYGTFGYRFGGGRYGIPYAAALHGEDDHSGDAGNGDDHQEVDSVDLSFDQHSVRVDLGVNGLGRVANSFQLTLNYADWQHRELEVSDSGTETVGTKFDNSQFVYRGVFEQQKRGISSGSYGFWGMTRDYSSFGEEALSPPVKHNAFALFTLQELSYSNLRFQFGGRFELNRYHPESVAGTAGMIDSEGAPQFHPDRSFPGLSVGAGVRVGLWKEGAFVANYSNAYRSPALEELYNFGPHLGNLAFEIGNPHLTGERSNGLDLSLRHRSDRVSGEVNFFYYHISDFIYLVPTGREEHGLQEAKYLQDSSRFTGVECTLILSLNDLVWLDLGLDSVDARVIDSGEHLPRIPPLRGRLGIDIRYRGLSLKPEWVVASRQNEVFETETETPGYGTASLTATYSIPRQHTSHHFSVTGFNLGNRLFRNHVSFLKDLAPEMGRGVKVAYVMNFF